MLKMLFAFFILSTPFLQAAEDDKKEPSEEKKNKKEEEVKPLKLGNLSLSSSQQPGPLVGFGENVIDKGQTQFYLFADQYKREKGYFIDVMPGVLYAFTDNCSIFVNLPVAPRYKERKDRSEGLEDAFIQLEYAYYNQSERTYTEQATIVANVTFPTGLASKKPETGYGSPSFYWRNF